MIEELRPGLAIVGTAHISAASVAEVERAIREQRPQRVLVEVDERRLHALTDPDAWQNTDIVAVIRQGKQHLFLLQLYLGAMQARMGRETGVAPGADMLRAVQVAKEVGAEVVLIDRDVAVTLRRGFGSMGCVAKLRLAMRVLMEVMVPGDGGKDGERARQEMEAVLETRSDAITQMTEEFARFAPQVKVALIDERDDYMASHIDEQSRSASVVAVVGAGHMAGIRSRLAAPAKLPPRASLETLPPKRWSACRAAGMALPVLLLAGVIYLASQGQYDKLAAGALDWVVWHVVLAGLGASLAFGHPLAVLTGAASAPFTSLIPMGPRSGWLAGFVQAKTRTPKVRDFQAIKTLDTMGQFWKNGVVRVLLVTALTNLGSMVATYVVGLSILGSLGGP